MIKCQFSCHARAAAVRLPTTFRLSDYTHVPFFHIHSPHNTGSPLQPRDPDQCTRARVRTHLLFRRHSSSSRKPAAVRPQAHRDVLIRCAGGLYTSHQAHTHTHTHTQTHTHAHTHTRTHTHTHTHTTKSLADQTHGHAPHEVRHPRRHTYLPSTYSSRAAPSTPHQPTPSPTPPARPLSAPSPMPQSAPSFLRKK